jgi:cytochrome c peroxidase
MVLVCCLTSGVAQEHWDDRAIKVFPSHDEIGPDIASIKKAIEDGRTLFRTRFNTRDGAGRPMATGDSKPTSRLRIVANPFDRVGGPDASACSSCHNQPKIGGSGDSAANVFVGAHFADPPTPSTAPRDTNERNTVGLFGSGVIEIIAREMTEALHEQRANALEMAKRSDSSVNVKLRAKGVDFGVIAVFPDGYIDYRGIEGLDYDLVVKPFGIKGIVISLREFTIGALNQHHGIQAMERFGWERTGMKDFDEDGVDDEFSIGQVTALTIFQASLPPPRQKWSENAELLAKEKRGGELFGSFGCASCHIPAIVLNSSIFFEPNKFNRPGALTPQYTANTIALNLESNLNMDDRGRYIARAFTDLKRHRMCDREVRFLCNEMRKQDNVGLELFMTQKLWDLATSGPYCHRGDCTTLGEAILVHGGEGRASRDAFVMAPMEDKRALIAYLNTLGRAEVSEDSP